MTRWVPRRRRQTPETVHRGSDPAPTNPLLTRRRSKLRRRLDLDVREARVFRLLFVATMLLLPEFALTSIAQSQATTGVIEGTVADESGGRLPGAAHRAR